MFVGSVLYCFPSFFCLFIVPVMFRRCFVLLQFVFPFFSSVFVLIFLYGADLILLVVVVAPTTVLVVVAPLSGRFGGFQRRSGDLSWSWYCGGQI